MGRYAGEDFDESMKMGPQNRRASISIGADDSDDKDFSGPTLQSMLQYTEEQLSELSERFGKLTDHLALVLKPEPPRPSGDVAVPQGPEYSPMAMSIDQINGRISRLIRDVKDLDRRVNL